MSQLLDRLRRSRLPPGAAAGVVAVPAAGDQLSVEVAFLFAELDAIQRRGDRMVSAARDEAAQIEASAAQQRAELLDHARAEGERMAADLLAARRAGYERRAQGLVDDAGRRAASVLARGRERTPALAERAVSRLLEDGA